jgi:RNA polymerase sigma factor (sigma-70 family)
VRSRQRARGVPAAADLPALDAQRVDLQRALLELSPKQREVVVLRYVVDLPEAAVAESLGCSVGTVKTHASRGLAALRRSLEVAG